MCPVAAIADKVGFEISNIFRHVFGHGRRQKCVLLGAYHQAGNIYFLFEISAVLPIAAEIAIPVYATAKAATRESAMIMVKIGRVQDLFAGPAGFVGPQYF